MLSHLSIRDIVLIEKLDLDFAGRLTVLTGETGAGKSIVLDAFALALGSRGDAALVRQGAEQGQVVAAFDVKQGHPALAVLKANDLDIDDEGDLILRRVQLADGRTRAFINDQPVSVQVLREVGGKLVEIHGQHDERALVDQATHRMLLDAFAGHADRVAEVRRLWSAWREAEAAEKTERERLARALGDADYVRHAVEELKALAPQPGEEQSFAERRAMLMRAEKISGDLREAHEAVAGGASPVPLSVVLRKLERRTAEASDLVAGPVKRSIRRCMGWKRPAPGSRPRWRSPISTPRSSIASRSGCSRCARRRGNTRLRSTPCRRWRRALPPIWRPSIRARSGSRRSVRPPSRPRAPIAARRCGSRTRARRAPRASMRRSTRS
jgi:DNA repair protein RecN (Recombination protein N)